MTKTPWAALALLALLGAPPAHSDPTPAKRQPAPPRLWQQLPPSPEEARFQLPARQNAPVSKRSRRSVAAAPCPTVAELAGYSGNALASRLASIADYSCTYPLFSLNDAQGGTLYSAANVNAVAARFAQEAAAYDGRGTALVNLTLYLRAGYYQERIAADAAAVLRPAIAPLLARGALFAENAQAPTTAGELMKLITNMHDEGRYLREMRALVARYTNTAQRPDAASALRGSSASQGMTGVLTVYFYAHGRADARPLLEADDSHSAALYHFATANRNALVGDMAYMLGDATRESLRFLQYPALKAAVKARARSLLAATSMTGPGNEMWLAAAEAIKSYDAAACADYGTCGFEARLADAVLPTRHACGPTLRLRAQDMTREQLDGSCRTLQQEEGYFHRMLSTGNTPVADDRNTQLEVVVFDDYANYAKYAPVLYGISTNNGGMYLEGDPAAAGNQPRFIAHEASWLRPEFKIWNLEHEYVHYLDGRFNLYGDFGASTRQPTVWWIEGVAEYLSLRNDNAAALDAARGGAYRLSQIFGNHYQMDDYVTRAYRWGYAATRFMVERHRADVDSMLGQFRRGDYDGYMNTVRRIGTRYDAEFAQWAATAGTSGEPPLPSTGLPACQGQPGQLGKNCALPALGSDYAAYAYIMLPQGARNLRVWSEGGSGDVDLYLAPGRYPSPRDYELTSARAGNAESLTLAQPQSGRWYYVTLHARRPFANVTLNASYD